MDVGLVARLTVSCALGALAAWVLAVVVALSASSVAAALVLRSVLTLAVLFFVTRVVVRRAYARPALWVSVTAAAALSYTVFPPAWSGRALAAQAVVAPGVLTTLADLVPWVLVVVLAARTVSPRTAAPRYQRVETWR